MLRSRSVTTLLVAAATAEAQALRYVDEYGVVHWVKSRDQIPEKYRDKAEKPQVPGVNTAPTPRSYKQEIAEICDRDTSLHTKMQCERWMRLEALQAEYEQKRRDREYEMEQKRREYEAQREEQRRLRQR
jgi:hypothetical protein